jgi:quercetin dioxygenase-like cupin family protein
VTTTPDLGPIAMAEIVLPSGPLAETLAFFTDVLGFRIETIFPAEDPTTASLSGHGLRVRLSPEGVDTGTIRLTCETPPSESMLAAPNGTRIELVAREAPAIVPPLAPAFVLTRSSGPSPVAGRAGMIYRDLIPDRQGGRFIASHIALPAGGPVADWVHFHRIRFQLIFCRQGWARLVYEDQGPPFLMRAGDCVLQPPEIRHRVLETSEAFEVIEVSCPALHETLADHDMALPTGRRLPDRDFAGQRFMHHVAAEAPWVAHGASGFERRDTGLAEASHGLVDACVLRPAAAAGLEMSAHERELLFGFVLDGAAVLEHAGDHPLGAGDAFVILPGEAWALRAASPDLVLLQVIAPAKIAEPSRPEQFHAYLDLTATPITS